MRMKMLTIKMMTKKCLNIEATPAQPYTAEIVGIWIKPKQIKVIS